jgi:hypothetical protein
MLPMGFAPKSGGALVNTLRPATLIDAIAGETWHEALALAERFYTLASSCGRFSANFAPCLAALRTHLDEASEGYRVLDNEAGCLRGASLVRVCASRVCLISLRQARLCRVNSSIL